MTARRPRGSRLRASLLRWHRWVGVAAAVIVLLIAITGIALNHSERLGLRRAHVDNAVVLNRYGLTPTAPPISFPIPQGWMTWLEGNLYLNDKQIAENTGKIIGAIATDHLIAAAASDQIVLLTLEGQLVERILQQALPGTINQIGVNDGMAVLATDAGHFVGDSEFLAWTPTESNAQWSQAVDLPPHLHEKVLEAYRGLGISADRLVLDIHTGRFFGAWGPAIFDIAAIALIFLAITGVVNWLLLPRKNGGKTRDDQA